MNTTITISKKLIKGNDLVILPRRKYEELVRISKKQNVFLNAGLRKALRDIRDGKVYGPFHSVNAFKNSLER